MAHTSKSCFVGGQLVLLRSFQRKQRGLSATRNWYRLPCPSRLPSGSVGYPVSHLFSGGREVGTAGVCDQKLTTVGSNLCYVCLSVCLSVCLYGRRCGVNYTRCRWLWTCCFPSLSRGSNPLLVAVAQWLWQHAAVAYTFLWGPAPFSSPMFLFLSPLPPPNLHPHPHPVSYYLPSHEPTDSLLDYLYLCFSTPPPPHTHTHTHTPPPHRSPHHPPPPDSLPLSPPPPQPSPTTKLSSVHFLCTPSLSGPFSPLVVMTLPTPPPFLPSLPLCLPFIPPPPLLPSHPRPRPTPLAPRPGAYPAV